MVVRFVIYARFSSHHQKKSSIVDQIRKCREYAAKMGWVEIRIYTDEAQSGVGMDRAGLQQLLKDAEGKSQGFEVILLDDSSRLSRSLSDVIKIYERFAFSGVRVISVSQGVDTEDEQSDVLIAFHGIKDSLYVKELAKKTHRGLEGQFLNGKSAGGRCYGYNIVKVEDDGSYWVISEEEARVVRQIFLWSAAGYSLKSIAGLLNERKIAPPQKRKRRQHATWCPTAIRAMLRRELYIGTRVWNKTKFKKRPGTNKRVAEERPRSEWHVQDAPKLRIISDELWTSVQKRQEQVKEKYGDSGKKPVNRGASSGYLLSGFLRCGICDAKLIIVSGGGRGARYGCPQHWNRRACSNSITILHTELEQELFHQLQDAVLAPEAVDYLIEKLLKAQRERKPETEYESRSKELRAEINRLVTAIAKVDDSDALLESLKAKEAELRELSAQKKTARELTPDEIRSRVNSAVLDIPVLLRKSPELAKTRLAQHVDHIHMLPQIDGTYEATGEWDLLGNRGPVMVAGAGFEPATFGL
jgi:DNA invertase Pin-like site-specific DNA recombinase